MFEHDMLDQYPIEPSIWLCYTNDIFMIWKESDDKLKDFLTCINTVNPAIQFTRAYSFKCVNFLDVLVTLATQILCICPDPGTALSRCNELTGGSMSDKRIYKPTAAHS